MHVNRTPVEGNRRRWTAIIVVFKVSSTLTVMDEGAKGDASAWTGTVSEKFSKHAKE